MSEVGGRCFRELREDNWILTTQPTKGEPNLGLALKLKPHLKHLKIFNNISKGILAIDLGTDTNPLRLVSVYGPGKRHDIESYKNFINKLQQITEVPNIVIIGDFNGKIGTMASLEDTEYTKKIQETTVYLNNTVLITI